MKLFGRPVGQEKRALSEVEQLRIEAAERRRAEERKEEAAIRNRVNGIAERRMGLVSRGLPQQVVDRELPDLRKQFEYWSRRGQLRPDKWERILRRAEADAVELDRLLSGGSIPVGEGEWQRAEVAAMLWMRADGWPDAEVTGGGADSGIDVQANKAVAQVKWYTSKKVGRPEIQQLRGAAGNRKALFFASAAAGEGEPYSTPARTWAKDHSSMRLLAITRSGSVVDLSRLRRTRTDRSTERERARRSISEHNTLIRAGKTGIIRKSQLDSIKKTAFDR